MGEAFYWIGVVTVSVIAVLVSGYIVVWLYAHLLHGRFGLILFRRTRRRLSIASWHEGNLVGRDYWPADDFPIADRPFYVSYEIGQRRRLFLMLGVLEPHRSDSIKGDHP